MAMLRDMKFELKLRKRNISKEELVADLQKIAKEVGQDTITAVTYTERGAFGVNTMLRRFGSWNEALNQSGLALNNRLNVVYHRVDGNISWVDPESYGCKC